jgi:hypothetical protein
MGGVEVHLVPGDHVDMMSMRHVHAVADKLAAYLDGSSNHKMGPFAGAPRSISSSNRGLAMCFNIDRRMED